MKGTLLGDEVKRKLFTPNLEGYAYGWNISRTRRNTALIHQGGSDSACGLLAGLYLYPEEEMVIVFLANSLVNRSLVGELLAETIEDLLFGRPVVRPPPPQSAKTSQFTALSGISSLADGENIEINRVADHLVAMTSSPTVMTLLRFPESGGIGIDWGDDQTLASALAAVSRGDMEPLRRLLWESTEEVPYLARV